MKLLETFTDKDIFPDYISAGNLGYRLRNAGRAIVQDEKGAVALLAVTKKGYHKLPGGGVEEGEDIPIALAREIMEEIGCEAEVVGEVGQIIEYRDQELLHQESFCYLALLTGSKGKPDFTEDEKADGFEVLWVDSLQEAVKLLENDEPGDYNGKFIKQRDLFFLKAAQSITQTI